MSRLLALSLTALAVGCSPASVDFSERGDQSLSGRMEGDLATVVAFDDTLSYGTVHNLDGYPYIEMHVLGEYGWAMLGVTMWGWERLEPGLYMSYSAGEGDEDGSVIGCSGPDEYDAEFDQPAEEATVEVTEGDDGEIVISVDVSFGPQGDVSGTATVEEPPSQG